MMNNQNVDIIKIVMDFLLKAYTDRTLILQWKLYYFTFQIFIYFEWLENIL